MQVTLAYSAASAVDALPVPPANRSAVDDAVTQLRQGAQALAAVVAQGTGSFTTSDLADHIRAGNEYRSWATIGVAALFALVAVVGFFGAVCQTRCLLLTAAMCVLGAYCCDGRIYYY